MLAALIVVLLATATLVAAPLPPAIQTPAAAETITRFLASGHPPLTAFRARRHLEAASRGGKMTAELDAWTTLTPDGKFTFEIERETGSGILRQRVLRAALIEEQDNYAGSRLSESAFTRENYDFRVEETARDGEFVRIGLSPRRKSQLLVLGTALVRREDADLVTIQGTLSKRPSFWTRRVDMTRHYARIDGVRVPIEVKIDADVRLVGDSSFSMTYEYATINGKPVSSQTN